MHQRETAKAAHRADGGDLRELEQLGSPLENRTTAPDSAPQASAVSNTIDHRGRIANTTSSDLDQGSAALAPPAPRPSVASRVNAKPRAKVTIGVCRECGGKFEARRATKEFCSTACRQALHNLAMTRGAPIYHLVMAWRDDRSDTTALTLLCRLAAQFKDQDARDGRRSWDAGAVRAHHAHLQNATVLDNNVLGLRRTERRK